MRPRIISHRTAMGLSPPNSMAGLIRSSVNFVDSIECDISFTKDGKPMIWLDQLGDMLLPPIKNISGTTLAEVKKVIRKDCPEKILTIEDIFMFMKEYENTRLFFDVKYCDDSYSIEQLGDLKNHYNIVGSRTLDLVAREIIIPASRLSLSHRIGFITFWGGVEILKLAKEADTRITTATIQILPWFGISPFSSSESYINYIDWIVIGWKNFNQWKLPIWKSGLRKIKKLAEARDIPVHGGIANTEEELRWCLKQNFQGIWTDNPVNTASILSSVMPRP